jgi:aromatic ring-opening dioxygenase catalytic subunit (LigB family)
MTIAFACAISHAPGYVAWPEAAPAEQKAALYDGAETLRAALVAAEVDSIVLFTSEHWTNFFLDHIGAMCVGRGDVFHGPVEPWLRMERTAISGDPDLADAIVQAAYAADIEPSFAHELKFDHGTMIPLKFLTPAMDVPVVPIIFNTLAAPQPSPRRCFELGRVVGEIARSSKKRIALVATGGMSHDPGERGHGWIDQDFDRRFLAEMTAGDVDRLRSYTIAELAAAGAGAVELINWIALAGAMGRFGGEVVAYEAVVPWATGMGLMQFDIASKEHA